MNTQRMAAMMLLLGAGTGAQAMEQQAVVYDWGFLTATFIYLLGISQVGVVFAAMMRLVRARWARPFYRIAEIATVAFLPIALIGLLAIYMFAREQLFFWLNAPAGTHLSPWLDEGWYLVRELVFLTIFYGLTLFYFVIGLGPDKNNRDPERAERRLYLLSPVVLLAFGAFNTIIAWDFGMMLYPHWHSTVFPIHFWFTSVLAGCAALAFVPLVLRKAHHRDEFETEHLKYLGMLVTAFTLMWLYFFWAQYFVIWFGNMPQEFSPLWRQMYGHYAPYFWTMMAGCFFIPFISHIFAWVKRSLLAMCVLGIIINIGAWLNKYLWLMPAITPDAQPFGSVVDVLAGIALIAVYLGAIWLLARFVPIFSRWEMAGSQGTANARQESKDIAN